MQAKYITQAVSPDEYDEAVRHDPTVSTLSATGDMRTGRQLLEDMAADQRVTVRRMARVKRKSAVLCRLRVAAFTVCMRLEARCRASCPSARAPRLCRRSPPRLGRAVLICRRVPRRGAGDCMPRTRLRVPCAAAVQRGLRPQTPHTRASSKRAQDELRRLRSESCL